MQGTGAYWFADGSKYLGQFQVDQKHGRGLMVSKEETQLSLVMMNRDQ